MVTHLNDFNSRTHFHAGARGEREGTRRDFVIHHDKSRKGCFCYSYHIPFVAIHPGHNQKVKYGGNNSAAHRGTRGNQLLRKQYI